MALFHPKQSILMLAGMLLAWLPAGAVQAAAEPAIEIELYSAPLEADQRSHEQATTGDRGAEAAAPDYAPLMEQPDSTLSIAEALARALANQPELDSLEKEYWALDSLAWQEGRRPNPELELEFEEFGGTREAKGFRALATTLTYSQPIERGGKRSKRETAAALERELVVWDIAELEHLIQAQVRQAYAACQAAQFELVQLRAYRQLLLRIHETVAASVEAGRSARLELERFDIELARLDLELAAAKRRHHQALLELAGVWGATALDFTAVEPAEISRVELPTLAELQQLLDGHPALARFDAEYQVLCALVDLEHANGVPDMALFGGVTRLNEIEETVFKVGVALDLPLHDKNEGNISAAAHRLEQVADNQAAARMELETELAALYQLALNAQANYLAYGEELLPAANEALALTEEGYRYGKFELLDVLDAQRTLLELESEQAAASTEFNLHSAEIEALLNISLLDNDGISLAAPSNQPIEAAGTEQLTSEEHNHE